MSLKTSTTYTDAVLSATGFTTDVTVSASLTQKLNQVTVNIPEVTGTSNAATFTLTGLPEWSYPPEEINVPLALVTDDDADFSGSATIGTDGVITLFLTVSDAPSGTWTTSGGKGMGAASLTWFI